MNSQPRSAPKSDHHRLILLTGATGYVGGRLLGVLEERGERIRCLARTPEFLRDRVRPTTEVMAGDLLDAPSLEAPMRGVHTAFYLVHSMGAGDRYAKEDRQAARAFGLAAHQAGVQRIVYLGGLGTGDRLSPHLESRQEVGRILRESGVPTIEFRAAIILGSGSLSFEVLRALVEKLPIMVTPRWVDTETQPIGIEDLIDYLQESLDLPWEGNAIFQIGGPDRVSYLDLMREYARQRGLRRTMIRVPFLTPRLSSLWLGLVTPVYARVGRALVDGLRNRTVVEDDTARTLFQIRPRAVVAALARALANEDREAAATRWCDSVSAHGVTPSWGGVRLGSRLVDSRAVEVARPADRAFRPIERIGGPTGWYSGNLLWRVRGWIDLLVGGAGLRRGRRDPFTLRTGDSLDFWRVEAFEPGRLLRLAAEMKLPGRAWLQFEVESRAGGSTIRQTAIFDPLGLAGLVYWYALFPLHQLVFAGMLRGIARAAMRETS